MEKWKVSYAKSRFYNTIKHYKKGRQSNSLESWKQLKMQLIKKHRVIWWDIISVLFL